MTARAEGAGGEEHEGLLGGGAERTPHATHPLRRACCATVAGAPLWAWLQLAVAVLAVSTAGTAFLFAKDVPPWLLAGWRLQIVTALLAPAAASQWRTLSGEERLRWRASVRKMVVAGTGLAFHFGLWVTAVQTTSLPHALLFVSATPVVLAAAALARRVPLSRGELAGTAGAMLGALVLVSDARSDTQVTLLGDMMALGAAAVFAVYLSIGSELRCWMPLFLYAVPVNGTAALVLCSVGMVFEGATPWGAGRQGVFGYFTKGRYAATTFYLALMPGIVGHTSFNAVLKYISPMVVTLALTTEPLIGSLCGWAAGVSAPPGGMTYLGGVILTASTMVVVRAEEVRKAGAPPLAAEAGAAAAEAEAVAAQAEAAPCARELRPLHAAEGARAEEQAATTP